jgi:hypothetical protein
MDLDLVGYLLGLLDAEERTRTEAALRDGPEARTRLERLRTNLAPLHEAREEVSPPAGLVERTLALKHGHRPKPARRLDMARPNEPVFTSSRWRRVDAAVAACILVMFGGLGVSGLGRIQKQHEQAVCQNNLRQLHHSLVGYSQEHGGLFPQVTDRPPNNYAGAFVPMLSDGGYLTPVGLPPCPVAVVKAQPAGAEGGPVAGGYAYSLGYRDPDGRLHGLRRDEGEDSDLLPILADRPAPAGHATGHNVLFIGGAVRFCTTPKVGVNGDDIFVNQNGVIAAGLNRLDSVIAAGHVAP